MRKWITILLAIGGAAVTAALIRGGGGEPGEKGGGGVSGGSKASPIYVGLRGDPKLEALLAEMDADFKAAGIRNFSAAEVTKMRKTPGPSYAIPPRSYWPRMITTLQLVQRIRDDWGQPISVYNGFRPEDYNEAVDGAPSSRHQWFEAVDLLPQGDRDDFAFLVATYYVREGEDRRIGFGVYGKPGGVTGVHVDTHRKRTWGSADYYVTRASLVS